MQLDAYGLTGDATWVGLSGGYETNFPVGQILKGRVRSRAGVATGVGDYDPRVTDQAFLPTDQLRGFAFAGVGPINDDGDTTTPLGGQKYATTSFELGCEVFDFDRGAVFLSAFWDISVVWDLPTTSGGFGPIDNDPYLRQSAGLETGLGVLSLAYGKPLQKQPDDRLQELSLTCQLGFYGKNSRLNGPGKRSAPVGFNQPMIALNVAEGRMTAAVLAASPW